MKKLLPLIVLTSLVATANTLMVKDANVTISVNTELKNLQKDANLSLEEGSVICFKEGKGRVVINSEKQLSEKSTNPCITLAVSDDFNLTKWFQQQKKTIAKLFSDSNESKQQGISRDTVKVDEVKQQSYTIPTDKKEILIYSESFGPLPVTLMLKDANGSVVGRFVNEESIKSMFRVAVDSVEHNYSLVITNVFEDVLLDVKLVEGNSSEGKE